MKLFSERGLSHVILTVVEAERVHYPSFHLQVEVSDRGFTASATAWVAAEDVQTFAARLRQCQRKGRSQAALSSMSPGELELRVEPSDTLGHFQVFYRVGRQRRNNAGWQELTLTGGFDLDVQFLDQMAEAAELLAFSPASQV